MIDLNSYGLPTAAGPAPSSRTLDRAGIAAEAAVSRRQRGLETECPRKLGRVTPQQCAALYRLGDEPCVSTLMGRCSLGMIEDQRQPKEDNMGKSNYGKCVLCGHAANRDSEGRCYRPACKEARKPAAEPFEKIEELPEADHIADATLRSRMHSTPWARSWRRSCLRSLQPA